MIHEAEFSLELWRDITLQPQQRRDHNDAMRVFSGDTWTFVDDAGHCIAIGGLFEAVSGVAVAWAYIGADAGPHMVALAFKARRILNDNAGRWLVIRSGALSDFKAGLRLLGLLGFTSLGVSVTHEGRSYDVFELARHAH